LVCGDVTAKNDSIPEPSRLSMARIVQERCAHRAWSPKQRAMPLVISGIVLYVRDIPRVAAFYQDHFGFVPIPSKKAGWLVLEGKKGNCSIALHRAAKSQRSGASMKIVFRVRDLAKFIAESGRGGLKFGPIHDAAGYQFSNAKDPAGNSISISSRGES
jgi:predicted enzyme related to lactoylglutathione lyase